LHIDKYTSVNVVYALLVAYIRDKERTKEASVLRLKELRNEKGCSQREVSVATGITENTLFLIEAGKQNNPTLNTIRKLADFYGCTADYIMDRECDAQ
jgi:transcriptional regulator with XRE-family HTH domain